MGSSNSDKAADILKGVLQSIEQGEGSQIMQLFRSWQAIVGEDIASHSAIDDIRNGTVVIVIDHPAWMQLLQQRESSIVHQLQQKYPSLNIERLMLKIGEPKLHNFPEEKPSTRKNVDRGSEAAETTGEEASEEISANNAAVTKGSSENEGIDEEGPKTSAEEFRASLERLRKTLEEKAD